MITDTNLTYTLAQNVIRSLIELSRQSVNRNYIWRQKIDHHIDQLDEYFIRLSSVDMEPEVFIDGSLLPRKLLACSYEIDEENNRIDFLMERPDKEQEFIRVREILDIRLEIPASSFPTYSLN